MPLMETWKLDGAARERYRSRVLALEGLGHRGSTTEREAEAARYLVAELRGLGLRAELEAFPGSGSMGARLCLHVVLALIGAALLWLAPVASAALGALALVSLVVEQSTRARLLGWFLVRRPSANVVARREARGGRARRRLVVLAHYDTQRTGLMWREGLVRRIAPLLSRSPGVTKSPLFPVMLAMIGVPVAGVLGLLVPDTVAVSVLGVITLVILGVATLVLAEWMVGPYVPGACDNASGTAAVISVAEAWCAQPSAPEVEVVFLLTGCEETGLLGAAAWADAHRQELGDTPTTFVNFDSLGYGRPRFLGREHSLAGVPVSYPADLVALCGAVATEHHLEGAGPHTLPVATDGFALLARGIPGVSILTFEDDGHMPNYHQLTDTSDRMDFDVAWSAVRYGAEVVQRMAR